MNTTIFLVSGIIAGIAGSLLPRKRRNTVRRQLMPVKDNRLAALEEELAPFVHFSR